MILIIIVKRKITRRLEKKGGYKEWRANWQASPKFLEQYQIKSSKFLYWIVLVCNWQNFRLIKSNALPLITRCREKSLITRKWICSNQPQPLPSFLKGNIVTSRRPTTPLSCLPSLGCGGNLIETSKTMSETIMWGSAASVEAATRVVHYVLQALEYVISDPPLCELNR